MEGSSVAHALTGPHLRGNFYKDLLIDASLKWSFEWPSIHANTACRVCFLVLSGQSPILGAQININHSSCSWL